MAFFFSLDLSDDFDQLDIWSEYPSGWHDDMQLEDVLWIVEQESSLSEWVRNWCVLEGQDLYIDGTKVSWGKTLRLDDKTPPWERRRAGMIPPNPNQLKLEET